MNIERFDQSKEITIQEAMDLLRKEKHPICRFECGDFFILEVALVDIDISLRRTEFCPDPFYGAKWKVCPKETWKYLWELEKAEKWYDIERIYTRYGDGHCLDHIEDIYQIKIKIIGIVEE